MIRQIDNPLLLNRILDLAKNIPDTNIMVLEKMLIEALTSKKAKIYIAERNNEVVGFIYGSIETIDGNDCVFIQSTYIKPDNEERNTGFEFLNRIKSFAKDNDVRNIYILTKRNAKAFERRYHFKYAYTMLKQEV